MNISMLLDNPFVSDTRVEKEAADLVRAGHRVRVTCMTAPGLPPDDERDGIVVRRRFPAEIRSPFRRSYRAAVNASVEAVLAEDYDALHCHDHHMLQLGVLAKERRPVPLVYDAHEFLAGWPFYLDAASFTNRIKGRLVWHRELRVERRNAPLADRSVTISRALSEEMTRRFGLRTAPVVLRNIPNRYDVRGDRAALRERYGIPSGRRVVVHSGSTYHTDRQVKALYRIVAEMPDVVLLILGSRPRHVEMASIARSIGLEGESVILAPFVNDPAERMDLMSGADVGLMHLRSRWLAHRKGFSNKFLEYTFAGLPVVSSVQEDCVAIGREYGHALFYEEDDDRALGQHLRTAIDDNDRLRARVGEARDDLSWAREVGGLLRMYEELA